MFAAPPEENSHDGASRTCGKDSMKPGSKVNKKAHSPAVMLPPVCREPPALLASFVARPAFTHSPVLRHVPPDRPLSLAGLPRVSSRAGTARATDERKWTQGLPLMASAFGTNIPIRAQSHAGKDESIKVTICKDKKITEVTDGSATKPHKVPLTGTEVVHLFAKKRNLGELQLYYLKEADGDSYRPYDLRVVHSSQAGSEHYIFSPDTVLHVTDRGYGGLVSLAEWYRESVLWTGLQKIPFIRDFRLRKAFTWWHRNARRMLFQRRCEDLQDMLLIAVPQFRNAFFLFTRMIEELKGAHKLPQEASRTYTLLEFKNMLVAMDQEFLQTLEKLSQHRAVILNVVKEDSYRAHQELQLHMEYAKQPNKINEPIHLHVAHQQELKKQFSRSKSILQKLGNFAALIDLMIVQTLVKLIQQEATSFLSIVLKRTESQQCCVFHTELCFSANSQLTVEPPMHLFQEALSEALLTVGDSVIQMCDSCGFFLEISNSVSDAAQDSTADFACSEHRTTTGEKRSNYGTTGCRKFCCWKLLRDLSSCWPVLPQKTSLMVQSSKVHGCYHPLSKKQLEWQISISSVTKQVEKEQAMIMQEAELEIQQLCESHSWLMDAHLFIGQWSRASLESMLGQPALLYEEHIKKIRHWTKRVSTVPSSVSTSNQLFFIQCTHIKESLGQQLKMIEDEVLEQLVEQIKLHSEGVITDLERATAHLRTEPEDLQELSKYALAVRESVKMFPDMQKRLEYIHSLQETIRLNYRAMTEQEVTLEEKMLHTWECFICLSKQADSVVCHRLPSAANAMDTMFSFLAYDLKNVVSKATAGPFLDPTQNAKEMVSALNNMCTHVHNLNAKLEQLSRNSQNLQEHPMDLTILTTDVQKVTARKELWELIAAYTAWMEEFKQLLFSEDAVSQAQGKISKWKEQALSLTSVIPTHDAVLQETLGNLERFSVQLAVVAKLQSPTLKHKHWKAIFEGMGLLYVPEKKVTVAELMSQHFEVDEKLINKICRDAHAEYNMQQTLQKLQQGWKDRLFQLDKFTLPVWQHCESQHGLIDSKGTVSNLQIASQHDARFTITGLEIYFADIENDLMTLSSMLKSPHSVDFRLQIEDWVQSIQDLGKLLHLFDRYQQIWTFLTKMFHENPSVQRVGLLEQFLPVDETFKEMVHFISNDPHVLNFVHSNKTNDRFHGNSLCQILIDGLSTMEGISNKMTDLRDTLCEQFPRLWFLTDREVIQLLSCCPTPFTLQPFLRKCFKGVCSLKVDCEISSNTREVKSCGATSQSHTQMKVLGVFGSLQEHVTFLSPLEPNLNALAWLCVFEKQLKLAIMQHLKQCAVVQNQLEPSGQDLRCENKPGDILRHITDRKISLPVLDLISEHPLQCLLVAEEAVWCKVVVEAFQESSPVTLSNIKAYTAAKLKNLGQSIRDGVTGARSESLVSRYTMMCLRAFVQLTMNHAQQLSQLMEVKFVPLKLSFEWISLMKYHIHSKDLKATDDPTCYVDVLGHRLQYDYEYFGPEDWVMAHTPSTDRAILGILLALTSYRCGFLSGPRMSGKKKTVIQLGKALGRQVVSMKCCPSMRPSVVQRMLLGAVQNGAWLLLDSVDFLTQGVLSLLGQHLVDIQQSFCEFTRNKKQRVTEEAKDRTADGVTGCSMVLAGKSLSPSFNYGCVLITSKMYASEVPESLRLATRPIALARPDYRIIAEVMLASIGFSEAKSLSRQLVSLITLARDSLCLPEFITDEQSCYLVVLQKIISASEILLQQSVRQREMSVEAKGLAAEQTDHTASQTVTVRVVEKDEKEKPPRLRSSHLSVIQGLMEETALVKAVLSVLLPVLCEGKKASEFNIIFKETFPLVCQFPLFQQYIEEEKNQLTAAVTEELQRKLFHSDTEVIRNALGLYQAMKFSQTVILIGPSGNGKTTCYCALAGALNRLAAKEVEYLLGNDNVIHGDTPQVQSRVSASTWNSVDTVVLFPNAMSHEELFGCVCEKRGWQDGAVEKVLRDLERSTGNKKSNHTSVVKWLVLDGKPVGTPGWLDYLTTLCSLDDRFLCLSSGETLPLHPNLKLLMEMTDLHDASPSAVARCSLVYFTGTDQWKAVWKSEMEALSFEHKLDRGTLNMWNRLAEDLFSSTLRSIRQKAFTSAIHNERESFNTFVHGLQEIMSFARILRALLQHFAKEVVKEEARPQINQRDMLLLGTATDSHTKQELLARNLFLVAYIWGFSGHLPPRHWPQFDLLARQVLFTCRYKIVVPDEESVFEYFFNIDSNIFPKNTLLTNSIIPKYGKHAYLLNLMLEANQPVLLAGEPGCGKTTLCKSLQSFDKPHVSLPSSPLLRSKDLRTIISNINRQRICKDANGSMQKLSRLLLFMDDLHEAPCDVYGKMSAALETLRQSISKEEVLIFDNYHLKLLSSGTISYMATCCVFGFGNHHRNVISSRLSRLFSIFVLPSPSMDVILSIHSPRLKMWLKDIPPIGDMVCCIITATKSLYHAVCDQFQPTVQRPHFIFSHHDLQKVFRGMCLWQPNILNIEAMQKKQNSFPGFHPILTLPTASALSVVRLWMHECMRTFSDRLCSEDESKTLVSLIAKTAATHYGIQLLDEPQPVCVDDPPMVAGLSMDAAGTCELICHSVDTPNLQEEPSHQSDLTKGSPSTEPFPLAENKRAEEGCLGTEVLQHMEDIMAKLVYGPDLSEALKSTNQPHNFRYSGYQDKDLDALLQRLCALIDKQEDKVNNDDDITTRCIIHKQRVKQLLHILRALLIPAGHGVLIGSDRSTGRKTTVRLAAFVTGYQLMEVHPGNENKLHNILKEAGNQTRVDGVSVIILVHEGISQSAREELLVSMAHRTYPGLYTDEELSSLISRVTAVKNSRRYVMDSWRFEKYLSQTHRNVHVFLLLPFTLPDSVEMHANNSTHGWNAQLTKALSSSCCVEVYQPWSNQSLVEVAAQCLKSSPHKMEREGLEDSLSVAMAGIHQSARQYASVLLKAQPFSPQTYMEFIAHFCHLRNHLHKQRQTQTNRVATVLSHLDVMNNTVVQCKQHLVRLQEKVAETQQCEKELLKAVEYQRSLFEEAQEKYIVEENKLTHLEEQINHAQEQVTPVFLSGLKILNCLNPSDLEEVRHYRDPPDGVVKIMDAICLLFNRQRGWESAKQLLGQHNFFEELEFFDRYTLTNEQLQQLGRIVHSPHFEPESVREVSKACESLCRWIQAVYECCCMQDQLVVKQQLDVLAKEAQGQLHLAKQHKEEACHHLEDVELQLRCVQKDLEELLLHLQTAESAKGEAAAAAGQLETHIRQWRAAAEEAELNNQTVPGDALILAAIISYLGPFGPDIRTELLSKWRELCEKGSINITPKDPRSSLFTHPDAAPCDPPLGFPIPVSERLPLGQVLGMLQEAPPARMVVKLLLWGCRSPWVECWPLLADTQQHLDISSQSRLTTGEDATLEKEAECGLVVCADDPELLNKLDQAAETGVRVLVTHLELAIPSPHFLARLARPAGCRLPGLKEHVQPVHPDFCLFLSTQLPVQLLSSQIHPSILAQVRVVDLSLSSEEIPELMLTQLLQPECKTLLVQHSQCQNDKKSLQEKLISEEDALMDYILQSKTSLPQDVDFLPRVAACQDAMEKLRVEIQQRSEGLEYQESLLAAPRHLMRLAAALYQTLQEVSRLSPSYYFPLQGFITVMQEAFTVKGKPLVSYSIGKVSGRIITEVSNRMVSQLLVQYRPCLTKSHFAVLKLLVSVALLQHNQLCPEAEKAAFLRGLRDIQHPVTQVNPCSSPPTLSQSALPSWIPPHTHPELLCLEEIPAFRGLIASLSTRPLQWHEYLRYPSSSVVGAVPCRSHSHLSLPQRALLWKTILPDCLEGLADAMAVYNLYLPGQTAQSEAPHTGNPEALLQYLVKHEGPIILTLPCPQADKWTSIQPLQLINKLAHGVADTEVQVKDMCFGTQCDTEVILSMLDKAAAEGHWLVFNNCHLLEQWDDKLVAHLSQLIPSFRGERCHHRCFRLWFVTQEYASCSIPASVRLCALPLVCDSSWDLKEELSCSLRRAASIVRRQSLSDVTEENVEPLLRCAIFHAVLLQRQTYKYSGRGTVYRWSQEDLLALMDAHVCIASLCHDKTQALHYIAVNLVHGGHVLDAADLEVVESAAKTCLSRVSPLQGAGPHILSDIISRPGPFDVTGLLQSLELQDSANINDPLVLGFSSDVAAEIIKISSHNLNVLLQASQTPLGTERGFCTQPKQPAALPAYSHARDRLQTLKNYLAHKSDSADTNAGAASHSPLRVFLQAEWDDLIDSVSSLLSQLRQPVRYSSPTLAPLLKLTDLSDLERRAELLSAYLWHHITSEPPGAYRLSAFKNARGFLVAVMRQAAQVHCRNISDIALHFQVLSYSKCPASLPVDAVCLCGLELRGASWDAQLGAIQDTVSLQPCSLPLVCVRAQVRGTNPARHTCESSHLKDSSSVQGAHASAAELPLYRCPLYLSRERESGNPGQADVNFITTFPLHAKLHPVLCGLRRVRLVSVLGGNQPGLSVMH